jgi:hypothetical protein
MESLTQLIAQEDFNVLSRRENFNSYVPRVFRTFE